MLSYKSWPSGKSLYNTPPCFGIYMVKLVTDWLLGEIGGLEKMHEINRQKAAMLYEAIDQLRRLLPGPRRAGQPLDHERHLPPAQCGDRGRVPQTGRAARPVPR